MKGLRALAGGLLGLLVLGLVACGGAGKPSPEQIARICEEHSDEIDRIREIVERRGRSVLERIRRRARGHGVQFIIEHCLDRDPEVPEVQPTSVNRTQISSFKSRTAFLYRGDDPVQTGVDSGTIEFKRAAVVRGRVLDENGEPLSGVTISIANHSEFGQTITRSDGFYDMAVNGGGKLTVQASLDGHFPVQRPTDVPWRDHVRVDEMVMVPMDDQVTTVDLTETTNVQVHQASTRTDTNGSRQATLMFKPNTQAILLDSTGETETVSSLDVRATEYSVGENGERRMPAPLPPTSAYTYAVELSADQTLSENQDGDSVYQTVQFSQPVPVYLENFIGFPVGTPVPAGVYDRDEQRWSPERNGWILEVVGEAGGIAELDVTGDGTADTPGQLSLVGVDLDERRQLASRYDPGDSLWRVPVRSFSPWDFNWGLNWFPDQVLPTLKKAAIGLVTCPEGGCCETGGSSICLQNQTAAENVEITGTPYSLTYKTSRTKAYRPNFTMDIPLTKEEPPERLKRIKLEVHIAGKTIKRTFKPEPNLTHTFEWDGRDVYGRELQGRHRAEVRIGYVYNKFYKVPLGSDIEDARERLRASGRRSFALRQRESSGVVLSPSGSRGEGTRWQSYFRTLGTVDNEAFRTGGWQLDVHHTYDPEGEVLYEGDGDFRNAKAEGNVIETVAGGGTRLGDTVPAREAKLHQPIAIDVGPDGGLYIAERYPRSLIRKVNPDGTITVVAGLNTERGRGFNGDGIPATEARLRNPRDVSVDDRGRVFIADRRNHRIRMVDTDGIIHTVAGTGESGFSGFGIPATETRLHRPKGVTVAPNGDFYIMSNKHVMQVVDGETIYEVAGDPDFGPPGPHGVPATQTRIRGGNRVEVGPDGTVYIATGTWQIIKVTNDGISHVVAGTNNFLAGAWHLGGDPKKSVLTQPTGMAIDSDGTVFINNRRKTGGHARGINNMVTKVDPTENIHKKVAGIGRTEFSGDRGPARRAGLKNPWDIALGPDNNLYIVERFSERVRVIKSPFPSAQPGTMTVPSRDGNRIFVFDRTGRHLRTVDARTGTTLFSFDYNREGLLTGVTDRDGQTTTIERDSNGVATAIVSPFGQTTQLTTNTSGFLTEVSNPAGEAHRMTYGDSGLLTQFTNPRGFSTQLTYDYRGRLVRDEDPIGGSKTLARDETDTSLKITMTTAMGRTSSIGFRELSLGDGDQLWTETQPDGVQDTSIVRNNGTLRRITREGSQGDIRQNPDPRFGMVRPLRARQMFETPGGHSMEIKQSRQVTEGDSLAVKSSTHTLTVNGRTYAEAYDGTSRTITRTSPEGRSTVTTLNERARVRSIDRAGLQSTNYTYNDNGQLAGISQGPRAIEFTYGSNGFLGSITDSLGQTTSFSRDAVGRVTTQTLPDGRQIQLQYDDNGNLTSLTPSGRSAHVFRYTDRDAVQDYEPPSLPSGATITTWTYNQDGQISQIQRPDMSTIDFTYESSGLLSSMELPADRRTLTRNPGTGQITRLQSNNGADLRLGYDASLPTKVKWEGTEVQGTISSSYDTDMRVSEQTISTSGNQRSVSFRYDDDGLLTDAGDLQVTPDAENGLLRSTSIGSLTSTWSQNDFGEVTARTTSVGDTILYGYQVIRDTGGRLTELSETGQDPLVRTRGFEYDSTGRLVAVTSNRRPTVAYDYDSNGNRIARTGAGMDQTNFSYDAQDRLLSYWQNGDTRVGFTYTANGELKGKTVGSQPSTTYDYDAMGNLRSVTLRGDTALEYIIDARNRRVGKRVDGRFEQGFLYQDQTSPVAELASDGSIESVFVYGPKPNVPAYMVKHGTTYRIVSNHLGSVRRVVNTQTGQVVQRMKYDAFGRVLEDSNPGFQPFGFAGGLYDHQTGLVRFGARDYDPTVGRWTSKDPLLFGGGSMNLYGYVVNDPVNLVDPSGNIFFISGSAGAACLAGGTVGAASQVASNVMAGCDLISFGAFSGVLTSAAIGCGGAFVGNTFGPTRFLARASMNAFLGIAETTATETIVGDNAEIGEVLAGGGLGVVGGEIGRLGMRQTFRRLGPRVTNRLSFGTKKYLATPGSEFLQGVMGGLSQFGIKGGIQSLSDD